MTDLDKKPKQLNHWTTGSSTASSETGIPLTQDAISQSIR